MLLMGHRTAALAKTGTFGFLEKLLLSFLLQVLFLNFTSAAAPVVAAAGAKLLTGKGAKQWVS